MSSRPSYTHGTPTWIHIPAYSVPRAKAFYTHLLHLQFRPSSSTEESECIAHFTWPNQTLTDMVIGGGIMQVRPGEKIVDDCYRADTGHIAPTMYYFVEDLDIVLKEVEGWGGKVLTGKMPEGEQGVHAVVMDTEGNPVGVYSWKKEGE